MHRTCKNTSVKPDRHCENGSISWRDGKNHQNDVTTCFATASRCVTTVPFSWRDGQNHQMMWPPAMQQHPGASIRFLFLGETDRITKWCDHQLCNSIQVHHYGSISWRDGQNHQMMWPPAMQQHPGASIRFLFLGETDRITKWCDHQLCNSIQVHHYGSSFMARRTESPNDVTTSFATASRCITTVPFRGETGRITTCRYKILRPVSHPPIVHSFVGTARTSGAVPPALKASLRFLFRGETDRITKWCDHQLCNSIQVRHDGSFFLARRTESPGRGFTSIQMFHTHAPQQRGFLVVRLLNSKKSSKRKDASTWTCRNPLIRLNGLSSCQPYRRLSVFKWITCTIEPHQRP